MGVSSVRAYADTTYPSSAITLTQNVHANRNLIVNGDTLIVAEINIPYTVPPSTLVDVTYNFDLLDPTQTTILGSTTAYAFEPPNSNNGFGYLVVSWYFPSFAYYGQTCVIRVSGSPAYFTTPISTLLEMPSGAWSAFTATTDNQRDLAQFIIIVGNDLNTRWALTNANQTGGTGLTLSGGSGTTVLSPNGESYFTHVIPALQVMAPLAFSVQTASGNYAGLRTYNMTNANIYENMMAGSWVQDSMNAMGGLMAVDFNVTGGVIIFLACIFVMVMHAKRRLPTYMGFLSLIVVLLAGVGLGWMPMAMMGVITLLCGFYIGYLLAYKMG
jgi:hypothetical protein